MLALSDEQIRGMGAGPELDDLVCEAVGIEPKVLAIATQDGGASTGAMEDPIHGPFWTRRHVEEWIQDMHSRGLGQGYSLGEWRRYPRVSTDHNAAFEVVEKMREKGFLLLLTSRDEQFVCKFYRRGLSFLYDEAACPSAPHAIAVAAPLAVKAKEKKG